MNKKLVLQGLIKGMEDFKAIHVSTSEISIHFKLINKESPLNTPDILAKATNQFKTLLNLNLEVIS